MTIAEEEAHYRAHLARLRRSYVHSSPQQRAHVANQRIQHPARTPNLLINAVSVTEGLARALVLQRMISPKSNIHDTYQKIKNWDPVKLVKKIAQLEGRSVEAMFTATVWMRFRLAAEYRNLLIHEATFLNAPVGGPLIEATETVFEHLRQRAEGHA